MNRALPLLALALPAPALACAPMLDPLTIAAVGAVVVGPLASPVAQGLLHALSERSQRAAIWARRFGGLNVLLGLGWIALFFIGLPVHPISLLFCAAFLVTGLYGVTRRSPAHSTA